MEDEEDDIPLLGRTAGRPDPVPIDGLHEIEEMSMESADDTPTVEEGDDLMARLLATMGSGSEEESEMVEEV